MSQNAQAASGQSKKCPKCQEDIQISANKCKHCGADLRNWFVRHKIVTGLLVLLVIGIIGSAMGKNGSEKSEKSPAPSSSVSTATAEVPTKMPESASIKITAAQLFAEYETNGIAADTAYKGKTLEVSGKVNNIDKDILDNPYVTLKTQAVFGEIQCFLKESEQGGAATLKTGMSIVIRGVGNGKLMNVLLKDCEVIQK